MIKEQDRFYFRSSRRRGYSSFRLLAPLLAVVLAAFAVRTLAFGEWADFRSWLQDKVGSPAGTVVETPPPAADPFVPAPSGEQKVLKPEPIHPLVARNVARRLPAMHLTRLPLNDEMANRALTLFIDRLDYDRTVFLASDIEEFRSQSDQLDDALKNGDTAFAFRVFETYKARLRNRTAYVIETLGKPFNFEVAESYNWKRKNAAWADSEAAWDNLWRLKVKNELLIRIVSRNLQQEDAKASTNTPSPAGTNVNAAYKSWENLSPEAFVRKRYEQQLLILEDHDAEWVAQNYISAFSQAYDPHTEYMSAAASEDFDIDMKLSLSGIGAVLQPEDGVPKVIRIIPGGPAERDGRLQPGDKIVAVAQGDGEPIDILHWPLSRAVRLIRGARGTKVVLSVVPASDVSGSAIKLALVRDEVKLEEEAAKCEIHEQTGANGRTWRLALLRLPAFYADMRRKVSGDEELRSSGKDVRRILDDLATNRVDGLLLDLRDNGGGSLGEAVEMTGLFLQGARQPIVQVKESWRVNVLSDPDPTITYSGPMAVLINRQSASASEILAAALQDYGRALMIGDSKTHGKGSVQTLVPVSDFDTAQGTIKVTAASFHRIGGGSTQLKGVKADIVIPSALECLEIGEEFLPYPFPWSMVPAVAFTPVTDLQPEIGKLIVKSEARRASDPRYTARMEQLRHLVELQKTSVISLRLADRMNLARSERALMDLQTGEDPMEKKKDDIDLVAQEAERILVDMLEIKGGNNGAIHGKEN